jgi:hypothetical protein
MRLESASSIQKVGSDDSIVAFQPDAADFFNSIGHFQTKSEPASLPVYWSGPPT